MINKRKFKKTEIGFIPEDWDVKSLNDIITKLGDGLHGTPKYDDNGQFYFINGNNLVNDKIKITPNTKKCSEGEFKKYKKTLNNRTLFVSINGTLGNISLYNNEKIILGKSVCYFSVKDEFNLLYIKYVLKNKYFQYYIWNNATGTTIKNVSLKQMREFKFCIPSDRHEQQAIAKILSDLDEKIELNKKMNQTLEEIGKTLFKRWFVDFEFLNEKGEPYKSSGGEMVYNEELKKEIPKGWSVDKLGTKLKTILGGTPSTINKNYWDGNIPWINSGKINEYRVLNPTEYITKEGLYNSATKLVPKGTTLIAITGATLGQVSLNEIDLCFNQSVVGILESDDLKKEFIYPWINYNIEQIINNKTGGAQQHINKQVVDFSDLLIPNRKILDNYYGLIKFIYNNISINIKEIDNLTQIRDSLLPKLMSGKIRVKY